MWVHMCAFLLVEAIVFINFVVFKDQLIAISEYLYAPCADQVYYSDKRQYLKASIILFLE